MTIERPEVAPLQAPLSDLERTLIEEFLRTHGVDAPLLAQLPREKQQSLLSEASAYASAKLAEIASRSHFVHDIHSTGAGVTRPHSNEQTESTVHPVRKIRD
jgi:hypothetical protein